ncbi:carbohydrate ABC transporter permease [Paenibacillus sp. 7516]|uniref:carbohydrate ABC transporter permease n=1 Tax=Paenibacillus sp. 7516 TaxID=2022549 RepID=UPI000BA5E92D|nr:carbohydrate ABC transporter permease [Paenibacillus sp. 7516]PAF33394.1 sugar ABC transporter permease [Paenibacillus sp. 7516]
MTYKRSSGETVFLWFNVTFMLLLCFATLYPFVYILFASISDPTEISRFRGMLLYPKGFSLDAYAAVLQNPMVLTGYRNTLFYVIAGTAINLVMTTLGAYALSRRNVYFRDHIMLFIVITMVFSGGLIPSFLLINNLGMLNTPWALLLPGAINSFNLIIMRTAFQTIPASLEESARIDGANDWVIMTRIIIPLSMPVIAVMILWYAVGHWNSYFNALIYLRDRELFPLQLVLREILISNSTDNMMTGAATSDRMDIGITIKYATIIVSTLPILVLYPFLQKYFVHGVMIGALKE